MSDFIHIGIVHELSSSSNPKTTKSFNKRSFVLITAYSIVFISTITIWSYLIFSYRNPIKAFVHNLSTQGLSSIHLTSTGPFLTPYQIHPKWASLPDQEFVQQVTNLETLFIDMYINDHMIIEKMYFTSPMRFQAPAYKLLHLGFGLRMARGFHIKDWHKVMEDGSILTTPLLDARLTTECGGTGDSHYSADIGFMPQYYKDEGPQNPIAAMSVGMPARKELEQYGDPAAIFNWLAPPRMSQIPFGGASISTGTAFPFQSSTDYHMKIDEPEHPLCDDMMTGAYICPTTDEMLHFDDERFAIREVYTAYNITNNHPRDPDNLTRVNAYHRAEQRDFKVYTYSLVPKHTDRLFFKYTYNDCPASLESPDMMAMGYVVDTTPYPSTKHIYGNAYIDADKEGGDQGNQQLNFTGAHTCFPEGDNADGLEEGQLLYMTGEIKNLELDNADDDYSTVRDWEALPIVSGSEESPSSRFYGVFLGNIAGDSVTFPFGNYVSAVDRHDTRVWVGAKGNMRALAEPGIYEAGDYLVPAGKVFRRSDTPGVPLIRCLEDIELLAQGKIAVELD